MPCWGIFRVPQPIRCNVMDAMQSGEAPSQYFCKGYFTQPPQPRLVRRLFLCRYRLHLRLRLLRRLRHLLRLRHHPLHPTQLHQAQPAEPVL